MSIVEAEHPAGVPVSVSVEIGGREITFETGKMAKQADGAVVVRSGETVKAAETALIARMSCATTMSAEKTVATPCVSLR